jgi:alpha-ketoglutaric semialdehyde dehydrogenase
VHLTGELLIGGESRMGSNGEIKGVNPATGETLEPAFGGATKADVEQAAALAAEAFGPYRSCPTRPAPPSWKPSPSTSRRSAMT